MRKKSKKSGKIKWTLLSTIAAVLAGLTVRTATKKGWKAAKKEPPPTHPAISGNNWPKALAWTAISGALAGMSRRVAEPGVEKAWEKKTGKRPPSRK